MTEDRDLYAAFYTDRLWTLLPEVYRALDSDDPEMPGPLQELVRRIGAQMALIRRSIDRTAEDQSIETCDDWLVPYLGDLVSTNLIDGLDGRAQRLDVAKTIYYRRRKGTVGLIEELAADLTGWNVRVVEFFRRLARNRHNFDPPIGSDFERAVIEGLRGALGGTPIGGFADLRKAGAASRAHTAFDEYAHAADFRAGRAGTGWYNIPKLGIFVWRLKSYASRFTTPVVHADCPEHYTFDPTGRDIPLFCASFRDPAQYGDAWVTPDQWMLPGPMDADLLTREQDRLYPATDDPGSVAVWDASAAGATKRPFGGLEIFPARGRFRATAPAPGATRVVTYCQGFGSEIGALPYDRRALMLDALPAPAPRAAAVVGGGNGIAAALAALGDIGSLPIGDSLTYDAAPNPWVVKDLLVQGDTQERPVLRLPAAPWVITGSGGAVLALEGMLVSGAPLVLRGDFERVVISCATLDPGEAITAAGVQPVAIDTRPLLASTLWIEGTVKELVLRHAITGPIRVRGGGVIARMQARDSIIQGVRPNLPGALAAADIFDPQALARRLRGSADPLAAFLRSTLAASVVTDLAAYDPVQPPAAALISALAAGLSTVMANTPLYAPGRFGGVALSPALVAAAQAGAPAGAERTRINRLLLEAAFPRELQPAALVAPMADVSLARTSVLGPAHAHRLAASESILRGVSSAQDRQAACVRFSAYEAGSQLHQPYESVALRPEAPVFTSERFGQPGYGQLAAGCDLEIVDGPAGGSLLSGAQDGSEMGAFCREKHAVKERGLRLKLAEYMPIGLTPVIIKVT